jgi:hypothetical protein
VPVARFSGRRKCRWQAFRFNQQSGPGEFAGSDASCPRAFLHHGEDAMKMMRVTLAAAGLMTAALSCDALGQQNDVLGKLKFPTSCSPAVQADFERGVAMIHSYWFLIARRTFEDVLKKDPNCAIAYWGIAVDYLGNTLATIPTRADAEAATAALEKARAIDTTERERGWIDALGAYYRDFDKTAVDARLLAYNDAMERLAQRYPDDYEAQVFYALALQASAPRDDTS